MHEGQFFCSSTLPGGYLYPLKISAGLVYILFFTPLNPNMHLKWPENCSLINFALSASPCVFYLG